MSPGAHLDADVAVVGAGPSGMAAAAACAGVGLSAMVVAPAPRQAWPNTYGCWLDELEPLELPSCVAMSWPSVRVVGAVAHQLPRAYGLLDNGRLQRLLADRLVAGGGRLLAASATGVTHFTWGSRLGLGGDGTLDVRLVIDATGRGALLAKGPPEPLAVQDAFGLVVGRAGAPSPLDGCTLMDWSSPTGAPDAEASPSFLYAMDLGRGGVLLEETSLARRTPLGRAELRRRLLGRLARMDIDVPEPQAEEEVLIPMGGRIPSRDEPVAAAGAAAGLVHPATGYSIAASLRVAPALAGAVSRAVDSGAEPAALARAAWSAVWPVDRRRARVLERFGLRRLLKMDGAQVRGFFDAFFSLPVDRWGPYLSGTASSAHVARTMAATFQAAPWPVRRHLIGL